jgi:gamma-glutamyltranspeptidase / glutathione hydrolase
MSTPDGRDRARTWRPLYQASRYAVASGHYLASAAGMRLLEQGGNAIDAGVATGICINVLQPDWTNFGGVAPIIIYLAGTGEVVTISGLGRWPRRARLEHFRDELGEIPEGVQNAIVPSACDAWLTALARYGRRSLAEVLAPAIELAVGFPVNADLAGHLAGANANLRRWPSSAAYLRPDGSPLEPGDTLGQPELAATFRALVEAERGAAHLGREGAIMAARDRFYKGDLAERMAGFSREQGGFLDEADLAEFSVKVEPPVHSTYRGYDVYACGPWCQGPVVPQTLNILEHFDLAGLGHNSARHLHLVLEALKASFADRHAYYGDPDFVPVPVEGLLDKEYARHWAERIRPDRAFPAMPDPGDPQAPGPAGARRPAATLSLGAPGPGGADTSYCCAVDAEGNGFSATPSDAIRATPIVPGVGVVLSPRGTQSWLDPDHPSSLQPWKRPRLTPNPALMLKDGRLAMVFGTPGGDVQPQAMVQLVVDVVDFGLDPQEAIEAPRVASESFPNSFFPHHYNPGLVRAEGRLPEAVLAELGVLGHRVERWPARTELAGALCAIQVDGPWGRLAAGADPRRLAYAAGW